MAIDGVFLLVGIDLGLEVEVDEPEFPEPPALITQPESNVENTAKVNNIENTFLVIVLLVTDFGTHSSI
ncbi:hypothetical protein BKI52_26750 [marine bacterium AO1-C]|nr:hypothetical protein BKI52_26750 [marine bacterium AO1-C]